MEVGDGAHVPDAGGTTLGNERRTVIFSVFRATFTQLFTAFYKNPGGVLYGSIYRSW